MNAVELDAVNLAHQLTLQVRVRRTRELGLRLWIARLLIMLACYIAGLGIEWVE